MILKELKPIRDRDEYSKRLGQLLAYDLFHMLYKPLIDLLSTTITKQNDKASVLIKAFHDRRIYWSDGFVYGKFNAAISKALKLLGAKYSVSRKAFKMDLTQLPIDIRSAAAHGSTVEQDAIDKVVKKTQELTVDNVVIPGIAGITQETIEDLHRQFEKVTPADLEIPVDMSDDQREKMKADYMNNIDLSIKGWGQEAIDRLRVKVATEVGRGTRAEDLKEVLYAEYGVTENRAKFIARQETGLFVSKFRQTRYEDAGLTKYRWSTSGDERVRESHKELNHRIFSWDDPPIVDKATGRRANPGEDFGCRCVALPVIMVAGQDALAMPNFGEGPYGRRRNAKICVVDLKPAEYFELVKEAFGYSTIQGLFATLITEKVSSIADLIVKGDVKLDNPVLEYKWTGKRILFWQDGRHRMKASLDLGIDSVTTNVFLPDNDDEVKEAFRIMPTWFIDKLKAKEKSLIDIA